MKEYKSVSIEMNQSWGGAKGTADTEAVDEVLNRFAKSGWELESASPLSHTAGTASLLCIFSRKTGP